MRLSAVLCTHTHATRADTTRVSFYVNDNNNYYNYRYHYVSSPVHDGESQIKYANDDTAACVNTALTNISGRIFEFDFVFRSSPPPSATGPNVLSSRSKRTNQMAFRPRRHVYVYPYFTLYSRIIHGLLL